MKNVCENCIYFDNEKHKNSYQTRHAGICKKWCEITFLKDTCKNFLSKDNPETLEPKKIINENIQTSLFFPL